MADINGTSNNDVIQGTAEDDSINGLNGQDTISGEGGDDSILGGGGDDILYGDNGEGTAPGNDASPLSLNIDNLVSDSSSGNNNAQPGDTAVYSNVAQLEDGTPISGRLVLVSTSDSGLNIDLSGGEGFEILLNSGRGATSSDGGETATFRMEFFDPATGQPVALNSTATFNDLDRNSVGDRESVTLDADSFSAFGTAADTSLEVTSQPGSVTAGGTEANDPDDEDAWFSAEFSDRTFIEFTLETRSTQSGFTMTGDLIDDAVVTPIEPGDDVISGGSGQDTIFGQGGDDSLAGDDGDDKLYGGSGNDELDGGQGQDVLEGGEGDDTLTGGTGDDQLFGGAGEDVLVAGPDNDRLYGGDNSDLFTIGGAGNHVIVGGEDADGSDIDVLDLTAGLGTAYADFNLIQDPNDPEAGRVELLDANGNIFRRVEFSEIENVVICFTPGTKIATPKGEVAVETLRSGDKVFTRDNGIQEIAWAGSRTLSGDELIASPDLQPVLVRAGSLGPSVPEHDLLLSPNHRLLLSGQRAALHFEDNEVFAAAKHMTTSDGVDTVQTTNVTYIHLMFTRHEVILSNGAWTESFQPGDHALKGVGTAQRAEIFKLFPELADLETAQAGFGSARRVLKRHEAAILSRN
jgi:Ca2+-binding RTX toxin-like protein